MNKKDMVSQIKEMLPSPKDLGLSRTGIREDGQVCS
jgi:hypothetical protein